MKLRDTPITKQSLLHRLQERKATIGIVGLGYVGLPLALRCSEVGYSVIGLDIDALKVEALNDGRSYIEHIQAAAVGAARKRAFQASTDFSLASKADALIICVPTPLNKYREPDLSFVVGTVNTL